MKAATVCDHELCESTILERPRYFPRQLISDTELTQEQQYFRDKLRRHNRLLHGWGVVCGALVCPYVKNPKVNVPEAWKVVVHPGYILGPYGDEIVIGCERVFDLRTECLPGISGDPCAEPPGETVDPWCSEVYVKRDKPSALYVAVRYKECMTRPVRVQPLGCGCDETQCEYTRWRDGYEICVLPYCPDEQQKPGSTKEKPVDAMVPMHGGAEHGSVHGNGHALPPWVTEPKVLPLAGCPPCPTQPWVVLAQVTIDEQGAITSIDNCACRRLVYSLASVRGYCMSGGVEIESVTPELVIRATPPQPVAVVITGTGFMENATPSFGTGVTVTEVTYPVDGQGRVSISATLDISSAAPGPRNVVVTNPDCSTAVKPNALTIENPSVDASTPREVRRQPSGRRPRGEGRGRRGGR
jgi:hypothetical protein